MAEYSKLAHGSFLVPSGASTYPVSLPFEPDFVQIWNMSADSGSKQVYEMWNKFLPQGEGVTYILNGSTPDALTTASEYPAGITSFSQALALQYGPQVQVTGINKANPATVGVTSTSGFFANGDIVVFEGLYQSPTTGMPQICGIPFQISGLTSNSFQIDWNTSQSNYTALSGSPAGAFVRKLNFPFLYSPGVSYITAITTGSMTSITTTAPNNFVVGQEIAFRVPAQWGTVQLNSQNNRFVPGSPVYGFVTTLASSTEFIVDIDSSSFTQFNSNIPVASVPGLSFPQVLAVGDVNTGGMPYSGGALYPSPLVNGFSTINGPAISGSFVNNTQNGFIIGSGFFGNASPGDAVYWQAYYHDYSNGVNVGVL